MVYSLNCLCNGSSIQTIKNKKSLNFMLLVSLNKTFKNKYEVKKSNSNSFEGVIITSKAISIFVNIKMNAKKNRT